MELLAAECELHPSHLRAYLAELMRLRSFVDYAARFRGSLPRRVRDALDRKVPRGRQSLEWARMVAEGRSADDPVQGSLL